MRRLYWIATSLAVAGLLFGALAGCIVQPQPVQPVMMAESGGLQEVRVGITTDADGYVQADAEHAVFGRLYAIEWVDGDLADGVDMTMTVEAGPSAVSVQLLALTDANDDAWYYPRLNAHDNTGATQIFTTGNKIVVSPLMVGKPRITVGEGGATKTGTCNIYYLP